MLSVAYLEYSSTIRFSFGVQVAACRQGFENAFFLASVYFNPLRTTALSSLLQSAVDAQLVLGLFTDSNYVTRGNQVRRDIDSLAIDTDGLVGYQLACFSASGTETHAVNDVVQTTLEQLQQVLTGSALQTGCFLVIVAELTLQNAIHTTDFLLLAQLSTVFRKTTAALTVNTRRGFQFALGVESAHAAFQEQVSTFATRQLALGTPSPD